MDQLNANAQIQIQDLNEILNCQLLVENLLTFSEWSKRNSKWNLEHSLLIKIRDVRTIADKLNQHPPLMKKFGQEPAKYLVSQMLDALECESFDDFVSRYRRMEKTLQFKPSAFTDSATKESEDMRRFINAGLAIQQLEKIAG